jgi:hypothetical protein
VAFLSFLQNLQQHTWAHPKDKKEERSSGKPVLMIPKLIHYGFHHCLSRQTVASNPPCKEHKEQRILRTLYAVYVKKVGVQH